MANHSSIGASSAHRWMVCPGSVALSEQVPPQPESVHAKAGTAAHWVIEQFFADETVDLRGFSGVEAPNGHVITDEDLDAIEAFIKSVQEVRNTGKFILHSEAEFELSTIHPLLYGTADVVLMESNLERLIVFDYKHGSGIPVEVAGNKQLMYYALGAIQYVCKAHGIDYLSVLGWGGVFKRVEVVVVQPRCRHRDGAVRSWTVSAEELDAFVVDLKAAAEATQKPDAPFRAGVHCRFCRAQSVCRKFQETTFELAQADFKGVSDPINLKMPDPAALKITEVVKVLRFADVIEAWLRAVEAHAQTILEHGGEVPGYKLVQKKTNRVWRDEDAAKETLELYLKPEDLYEKKFITPAKAEKVLGKAQKRVVEGLCIKPEGATTIAPDHDPREEVKGSAVADFQTLD